MEIYHHPCGGLSSFSVSFMLVSLVFISILVIPNMSGEHHRMLMFENTVQSGQGLIRQP